MTEKEKLYCFYFPETKEYKTMTEGKAKFLKRYYDREGVEHQVREITEELNTLFRSGSGKVLEQLESQNTEVDNMIEEIFDLDKRLEVLEKKE